MATEESDDKTIPTLVDVIVPGKTTAEDKAQQDVSLPSQGAGRHSVAKSHTPSHATLNAKIEALVAEILVRHMDEARKEIIRRVLSEIDDYVKKDSARS